MLGDNIRGWGHQQKSVGERSALACKMFVDQAYIWATELREDGRSECNERTTLKEQPPCKIASSWKLHPRTHSCCEHGYRKIGLRAAYSNPWQGCCTKVQTSIF